MTRHLVWSDTAPSEKMFWTSALIWKRDSGRISSSLKICVELLIWWNEKCLLVSLGQWLSGFYYERITIVTTVACIQVVNDSSMSVIDGSWVILKIVTTHMIFIYNRNTFKVQATGWLFNDITHQGWLWSSLLILKYCIDFINIKFPPMHKYQSQVYASTVMETCIPRFLNYFNSSHWINHKQHSKRIFLDD